jgi:hypothetical protein
MIRDTGFANIGDTIIANANTATTDFQLFLRMALPP